MLRPIEGNHYIWALSRQVSENQDLLLIAGVEAELLNVWRGLVKQEIQPLDEDDEF